MLYVIYKRINVFCVLAPSFLLLEQPREAFIKKKIQKDGIFHFWGTLGEKLLQFFTNAPPPPKVGKFQLFEFCFLRLPLFSVNHPIQSVASNIVSVVFQTLPNRKS